MKFIKEYLENEIPVVMEPFKNVRSVAVGIWVKVGSRYETAEKNGISHFLEHMFFKGTRKRTTKDIAVETDSMGGTSTHTLQGRIPHFISKSWTNTLRKVLTSFPIYLLIRPFPRMRWRRRRRS